MQQDFLNERDAFINILSNGAGYFATHAELEPVGSEWMPTGRMHVYLYRKAEGACTFFMELDAEEYWEPTDKELPIEIINEIGERLTRFFKASR